jgi:hypothetical protein
MLTVNSPCLPGTIFFRLEWKRKAVEAMRLKLTYRNYHNWLTGRIDHATLAEDVSVDLGLMNRFRGEGCCPPEFYVWAYELDREMAEE